MSRLTSSATTAAVVSGWPFTAARDTSEVTGDDKWAEAVLARIKSVNDLPAADALYHKQCSVNFRTTRGIPQAYQPSSETAKATKGRPADERRTEALKKVVEYFKEFDDEQITLTDLCTKMKDYLDSDTQAYTEKHMRQKLESHFGDEIMITCIKGKRNVVTFRLGFSLSYNEVKLFEMCAAVQQGTDLVGVDPKTSWIQFAADNVDHQIRTLDGTGTFHGMGIIGAATPGTKECRAVRRDTSVTPDRISAFGRVPVHFYNPSSVDLSLVYEILQDFAVEDRTRKLDLLWKVSWPLRSPRLGWSGMMQTICSGAYPGKSSFTFLPMIDMDPTNMSCIFSTLHFVSSVASRYDCTPVLSFDQPLWWKSTMIIDGEPPNIPLCSIVLRLGGFHCQMNFLGCIGRLMAGSGLKQVLEVAFASNSVIHMLSGKSVSRAVRGHFLVDTVLNALVTSIAFNIPLKTCSLTDAEDMDSEAGIGGSSSSPAFLPDETLTVLSLHQQQDEATTSAEVQNTADCTQDHSALRAVLRVFDSTISKETATEEFNEKANKDLDVVENQLLMTKSQLQSRTSHLWLQYMSMVDIL
ncbi:hypothetical protein ACOMHN_039990 [Nucella lapillus]